MEIEKDVEFSPPAFVLKAGWRELRMHYPQLSKAAVGTIFEVFEDGVTNSAKVVYKDDELVVVCMFYHVDGSNVYEEYLKGFRISS